MKLNLRKTQEQMKEQQTNPLFEPKLRTDNIYVIVILYNDKLVRISTQYNLKLLAQNGAPLPFTSIEVFPFNDEEIAKSFEKKVRYYYRNNMYSNVGDWAR